LTASGELQHGWMQRWASWWFKIFQEKAKVWGILVIKLAENEEKFTADVFIFFVQYQL